jgi:hypothetical protein
MEIVPGNHQYQSRSVRKVVSICRGEESSHSVEHAKAEAYMETNIPYHPRVLVDRMSSRIYVKLITCLAIVDEGDVILTDASKFLLSEGLTRLAPFPSNGKREVELT